MNTDRIESIEAYPLHWPPHRKRAQRRSRAPFHRKMEKRNATTDNVYHQRESLTVADSRDRLFHELELLGARKVIISSNLKLKLDGTPLGSQSNPEDPGVAVYFNLNNAPHCLSCDAWDRAADNLAAIAKYVEAMRGQIRWGVGDIASMFAGFKALPGAIVIPAPMNVEQAASVLACGVEIQWGDVLRDREKFKTAYRLRAAQLHPDANGGAELADWHKLQQAKQVLESHFGGA